MPSSPYSRLPQTHELHPASSQADGDNNMEIGVPQRAPGEGAWYVRFLTRPLERRSRTRYMTAALEGEAAWIAGRVVLLVRLFAFRLLEGSDPYHKNGAS